MREARPQFGLKVVFAVVTWVAAIAGLAVSQFAGWTMTAVAFSAGIVNCSGGLQNCQRRAGRTSLFCLGWTLLALSLLLPAVNGCGNQPISGWQAAILCGQAVVDPPAKSPRERITTLLLAWTTLGNALLLGSPFLLRRLQRGRGRFYGTLLATAVAAMCGWSINGADQLWSGYYAWCVAGLSLLCASPMRWSTLALMGLVALLASLT